MSYFRLIFFDKVFHLILLILATKIIQRHIFQKQSPEGVLQKRCSQKFCKIQRKTPVTQSLFLIKLQAEACNFIEKETLAQVFYCEFCEIYKNTISYRTSPVAASDVLSGLNAGSTQHIFQFVKSYDPIHRARIQKEQGC